MSFAFLPFQVFVLLCLVLCFILIYASVKRINKDRKGLIVLYLTTAIGSLASMVTRLIKEKTELYDKYSDFFGVFFVFFIVVVASELLFLGFTHKGDDRSRKIIRIALIIAVISAVPIAIILLLEKLGLF